MAELTEEDKRILRILEEADAKRDAIPPEKRIPARDPDKFCGPPIGIDDKGNLFPVKSEEEYFAEKRRYREQWEAQRKKVLDQSKPRIQEPEKKKDR
jgi:hypothetical protein